MACKQPMKDFYGYTQKSSIASHHRFLHGVDLLNVYEDYDQDRIKILLTWSLPPATCIKRRGVSCDTPPSVLETEPPHAVSCRFSTRPRLQNVNKWYMHLSLDHELLQIKNNG